MIQELNSLKEIQKYYDEKTNTYVFKENDEYIDTVVFNFDLNVKANIIAHNIRAFDIDAQNIIAHNIRAFDIDAIDIYVNNINADDIKTDDINASDIYAYNIYAYNIYANKINYYAVCFAYKDIKCKSIKGRRSNAKHFVLDGELEVLEDE